MRRVQFDDDDVCGLSAQGSLPEAVARSKNLKEEISAETRSKRIGPSTSYPICRCNLSFGCAVHELHVMSDPSVETRNQDSTFGCESDELKT